MKNLFLLILVAILFTGAYCRKDKISSVLPPITQEGKNTVGFKVNENVWVPYYECDFLGNPCGEISASYGPPSGMPDYFSFLMSRKKGTKSSTLTITSLYPITTTGNKYDSVNISFRGENWSGNDDLWGKAINGPNGSFEITKIDPLNQIISGTLSFTLYERNGSGRTLQITDGRFDFKMNACVCR